MAAVIIAVTFLLPMASWAGDGTTPAAVDNSTAASAISNTLAVPGRAERPGKRTDIDPGGAEVAVVLEENFGQRPGAFNGYVSGTAIYTDNAENTNARKEGAVIFVVSPAFWTALPRMDTGPPDAGAEVSMPGAGGFHDAHQRWKDRRYQLYAMLKSDVEQSTGGSMGGQINFKVQALGHLNVRQGGSVTLLQMFEKAHNLWGTGVLTGTDTYRDGLTQLGLGLSSGRLGAELSYCLLGVDYEDPLKDYLDRSDSTLKLSASYGLTDILTGTMSIAATSVDKDLRSEPDSEISTLTAGLKRKGGRIGAHAALGHSTITMNDQKAAPGGGIMTYDIGMDYRLTARTTMSAGIDRIRQEADSEASDYVVTDRLHVGLQRVVSSRINGRVSFAYASDDVFGGALGDGSRQDGTIQLTLSATHKLSSRLSAYYGFTHASRSSPDEVSQYGTNLILVRLTAGI